MECAKDAITVLTFSMTGNELTQSITCSAEQPVSLPLTADSVEQHDIAVALSACIVAGRMLYGRTDVHQHSQRMLCSPVCSIPCIPVAFGVEDDGAALKNHTLTVAFNCYKVTGEHF